MQKTPQKKQKKHPALVVSLTVGSGQMLTGLLDRKIKSEVNPQGHRLGFQNTATRLPSFLPGSKPPKSRSENSFPNYSRVVSSLAFPVTKIKLWAQLWLRLI